MADATGSTSTALEGDVLLSQLREGWNPLPTKTVFALVLGGLRVRLMRSVVTMMSIVFAIAFLTYTGLTNQLTYRVAQAARDMETFAAVDPALIEARVAELAAADPLAAMELPQKLALGAALGFGEVDRLASELPNMAQKLRIAKVSVETLTADLEALKKDAKAGRADLAVVRSRLDQARRELELVEQQHQDMALQVAIGRWIGRGQSSGGDDLQAELETRLRQRYLMLIDLLRSPGQLEKEQMPQVELLLDQAAARGVDLAAVREALQQEKSKRNAADLRNMLRRAGVSIEKTLAGNPLDTWLIIMAMLTCAVGIANAMLMSVTERFREIGTMKCLGAQDSLVVKLFLLESAFLGVIGAAIGIVMGIVVAVLAALLQYRGFGISHFPGLDAFKVVGLSVVGGIVLAVVGAVYPAFAASRMKPVDALRVDE